MEVGQILASVTQEPSPQATGAVDGQTRGVRHRKPLLTQEPSLHMTLLGGGQVTRVEQSIRLAWQVPSGQRVVFSWHLTAGEQPTSMCAQLPFSQRM